MSTKPSLTVDVNAAQQRNSRNARGNVASTVSSTAAAAGRRPSTEQQHRNNMIRPGDIVSEQDLASQNGFESDDDTQDSFERENTKIARNVVPQSQQGFSNDSQSFVDSESDDEYGHGDDVDMGSDEEDDIYDDEEDELSSSPSIPDENIDFDLVYALHNFIATVEGQATVSKGNSLTLLDDSNSYWWLVRVLRTQEVGYIPAENIETPFERLARLNKHRNVDLTSATDKDHNQVPGRIFTSHLVKSRAGANPTMSAYSGKPSALSRRSYGPVPAKGALEGRRGVAFGEPTYLEHSEYEYSDDGEMDDGEEDDEDMTEGEEGGDDIIEIEDEQNEDDDGDDEDDEDLDEQKDHNGDGERKGMASGVLAASAAGAAATSGAIAAAAVASHQNSDRTQAANSGTRRFVDEMRASNELTRNDKGVVDAHSAVQRRENTGMSGPAGPESGVEQQALTREVTPGANGRASLQGAQYQQQDQQRQIVKQQQQQQIQQQQQQQQQQPSSQAQAAHERKRSDPSLAQTSMQDQRYQVAGSTATMSPSQVIAGRGRSSSETSTASQQEGILNASSNKKDKRTSHRKSRSEDEIVGSGDEKQTKKRSGVFSSLFSRSKDKKERKSGQFASNSIDGESSRTSEDSKALIGSSGMNGAQNLQNRDRMQQEAYSRQFLAGDGGKAQRPRPGSLVGPPGSGPMLNVLRIFAGSDINSSATFKTVLLNESTTADDLLRQALQRFRLANSSKMEDFCLTVKSVDGEERPLAIGDKPLQIFDKLSEVLALSNRETPTTMPSVKRSSVGSISSVSSNLSQNPAIARLESDFSDDHNVKFYIHRRRASMRNEMGSYGSAVASADSSRTGVLQESGTLLDSSADSQLADMSKQGNVDGSFDTLQSQRFALRLLIFPSDLPDGTVFDPQSNALIPKNMLAERGLISREADDGVTQEFREKLLALPRNTTVADVIEQGLERFGILEGVVEGGDNVEDRSSRRRSKSRVRYGLSVKAGTSEQSLAPNRKVLDAYATPPVFKTAPPNSRRSKRLSTDSTMLLSYFGEVQESDPVFILRQVQRHRHSARPLSPTENVLATKQDQRRQAELASIPATSTSRAADPDTLEQQGMSRHEIIALQRAAARERRAAILGTKPNEKEGVDVMLEDRSRLRSSRVMETGKWRYSFIPVTGEEYDISAIVEDVLGDESLDSNNANLLMAPPPALGSMRSTSATSAADYVSAPNTPTEAGPIPLEEVNMTERPPAQSVASREGQSTELERDGDVLQTLVQGPHANGSVEDRIDQVLARIDGKVPRQSQGRKTNTSSNAAVASSKASSRGTASPTSGYTQNSGTTTPTPLSMLTAGAVGGPALAAGVAAAAAVNARSNRSAADPGQASNARLTGSLLSSGQRSGPESALSPASESTASKLPAPSSAMTDFGVSHLFALTDSAARKRSVPRSHSHVKTYSGAGSQSFASRGLGRENDRDFKPTVAGLFPPQAPYIEERRVKEAYAPIGRSLNGLEDALDKLLADVLRTF